MTDQDVLLNSVVLACVVKAMLLQAARSAKDGHAYLREVSECAYEAVRQAAVAPLTDIAEARADKIIGDVRTLLT